MFFFNDTATTDIYPYGHTLSLHDALPISYRASLGGKEAPVIDGFTGDQRFFIAYAQTWATKTRDAALRQQLATDGHAPGMYRALTVRNLDAWYKAFDVKEGDTLYLPHEKRVRVRSEEHTSAPPSLLRTPY